jgi:hypothetical protein
MTCQKKLKIQRKASKHYKLTQKNILHPKIATNPALASSQTWKDAIS